MTELNCYLSNDLSDEEMKENDISDRDQFVVDDHWRRDSNFEELSVGYFKFQSKAHRNLAKQKLTRLRQDEALIFSDCIHKQESWTEKKRLANLAWNVRLVPNCCCSPHIPHLVQDKMILIQEGRIVNRQFVENLGVQFIDALKGAKKRMAALREPNSDQKEMDSLPPSQLNETSPPSVLPSETMQSDDTINNTEEKPPIPANSGQNIPNSSKRNGKRNKFGSKKRRQPQMFSQNENEFGGNSRRMNTNQNENRLGLDSHSKKKKTAKRKRNRF